jgi:putative phage-type endonuclease
MIEQRSPEWYAARCGKVTASRMADVMAKTKTGVSQMRVNYAAQLIVERLTGTVSDSYVSEAMQFGTDNEVDARDAYAFYHGAVTEAGFVQHPSIDMAGASPDGYVGEFGLVEIKVPNSATHIDTLLGKSVPGRYIHQIQFQLACTGRAWCDFVSYDPRMPEQHKLFVRRVHRDEKHIEELETEVIKFLSEVEDKIASLNALSEAA